MLLPSVRARATQPRRVLGILLLTSLLALAVVPAASVSASARVAKAPCGGEKPPAKPGGGRWVCSFSDEFGGKKINTSKWVVDRTASNGLHVGASCLVNDRRTVSQGKGVLTLSALDLGHSFRCAAPRKPFTTRYLAGSVNTYRKFSQQYGRFEVRARFPGTTRPGLVSSLWLFPVKLRATAALGSTGEIDIAEHYTQYADRSIPYAHYTPLLGKRTATNCKVAHPERFHVYSLVWMPKLIEMDFDGVPCLTMKSWLAIDGGAPAPFNVPEMLALSTGVGTGANAPTSSTPFPARTQIDYIRVWR